VAPGRGVRVAFRYGRRYTLPPEPPRYRLAGTRGENKSAALLVRRVHTVERQHAEMDVQI
jgi:hypothetical protein